jgi:hypothetical protein
VASDIAKVIQGEKRQCDVRKNYEQKKLCVLGFSSRSPQAFPISYLLGGVGGGVANVVRMY